MTAALVMEYFLNIPEKPSKVRCKVCLKALLANRNFNLKTHLKLAHKIQFPIEQKSKKQIQPKNVSSLTASDTDNNIEITNEISNDSSGRESINFKVYGEEEYVLNDGIDTEDHDTSLEIIKNFENETIDKSAETSRVNPLNQLTHISSNKTKSNTLLKPLRSNINNRNLNDPLNESNHPNRNNPKDNNKNKQKSSLVDDPLDEFKSFSKDERFEQWAHKKEKILQLEFLEMRNYKLKLELKEKEEQLNMICSKYTKDLKNNS